MDELTDLQARFVEEYLVDLNATAAAKRAGYSEHTARAIGSENLSKPAIQDAIQERMAERSKRTEITADTILRELLMLATSDLRRVFAADGSLLPPDQWPDDVARAVSSVEADELFEGTGRDRVQVGHTRKVKFWDKPKALELLGKHLKLFTEVHEHKGKVTLEELVAGKKHSEE